MASRPSDLAERISSREPDDGFSRDTFRLPVDMARVKAREILNQLPQGGYRRLLSNGVNCQTGRSSLLCGVCGRNHNDRGVK